jgi:hypothetical protein
MGKPLQTQNQTNSSKMTDLKELEKQLRDLSVSD